MKSGANSASARERTFSRLVETLYRAAGRPEAWSTFVEELARATDADQALFVHAYRGQDSRSSIADVFNLEAQALRSYGEYFHRLNPYILAERPELPRPGSARPLDEILLPREVEKTEFFHDWVKPQGIGVRGALRISVFESEQVTTCIALHRALGRSDDVATAVNLAQRLMPHVQNALSLHDRLIRLESERDAAASAIERLPMAVLFVDAAGRPTAMSGRAESMLREADGLSVFRGRIRVWLHEEDVALRELIRRCGETAVGTGTQPGGVMAVQRRSHRRPLEILAAPLRTRAVVVTPGDATVALFVADPEDRATTPTEYLRTLYHLTARESELAVHLLRGKRTADIAEELGIAADTMKTHLRNLFAKTGVRRQSELIRVLGASVATLVSGAEPGTGPEDPVKDSDRTS